MIAESTKKLNDFIQKEYIENQKMGSPNIECGIRDLMTDLLHLCVKYEINIEKTLENADDTFREEMIY